MASRMQRASEPELASRVRIVGDHPHKGEAGTIREGGAIKGKWAGAEVMLLIDLDNGEGCYAEAKYLRRLSPEEGPHGG